jgi:hypothetical protein
MILGLSHVFGETEDLDAVVNYWRSNAWRSAIQFELPVPAEKKGILGAQGANRVTLHYLEPIGGQNLPGLEFVKHAPRAGGPKSPSLSLRLPMRSSSGLRDPDGNTVRCTSEQARPIVELEVPDVANARRRLLSFGFREVADGRGTLELSAPLFPQRSFSILLHGAQRRPETPFVDAGGWNGMSLLVRDLDAMGPTIPSLRARQSFSVVEGETREVAFFSGDGLLIEFLAIRKEANRSTIGRRKDITLPPLVSDS